MKSLKAAIGIGVRRTSQRKQAGVATIMVILMVGVGLVAVSVGTLHSMRNTQERQLVAHAQVNAQAGAWAAVEAVRQTLGTLTAPQLAGLVVGSTWNIAITGADGLTQTATIRSVEVPAGTTKDYKIKAEVGALATAGQSTSTIEVVYSVTPGGSNGAYELNGVLDFYNDLSLSGGLTLNAGNKQGLNFNVDGDLTADSIGVSGAGLKNISVTGNVMLGSATGAKTVRGRNIKLTGSSNAELLEAWGIPSGDEGSQGTYTSKNEGDTCCGEIETSGGVAVEKANANGPVKAGSDRIDVINTRRSATLTAGSYVTVNALQNVTISSSIPKASLINVGGNFVFASDDVTAPMTVNAVGNASCKSNPGTPPKHTIKAKGTIDANCKGAINSAITAPIVDKVSKVTLTQPKVDAWALKSSANYAIELEAGNQIKVTVKNVNGIPDDTYYLGKLAVGAREYLCKSVTIVYGARQCTGDTSIALPLCYNGNSEYNPSCFSADFTNKKFTITANSVPSTMAAGVVWFNGDLVLNGGPFFNTFIATNNISTSGDTTVYAVNYAANYLLKTDGTDDGICKNQRSPHFDAYDKFYPKNFCSETKAFIPQSIGNIGLLAGGINPSVTPKVFTGGEINLNSKNVIHGTVVAGNLLKTYGSTTVYGYISAAGLKNENDVKNVLTASTTVDLTKLPSTYKPEEIPDTSGGGAGTTAESKVLWTRYL